MLTTGMILAIFLAGALFGIGAAATWAYDAMDPLR
jgi:hypothetical protein